uniref:Ig-like domain-containing protein n=1 Tax=Buteo japonicus TaxID=224669 RepID=A0A8C0HL73_9AVES
ASVTVPTVFPLVACSSGTSSALVVACLVDGYFPEPVKVTWDSGTSPAVSRTFPSSRRPSGTYTLGSQLRVTGGEPSRLQCTVEHPSSGFKKTTNIPGTGAEGAASSPPLPSTLSSPKPPARPSRPAPTSTWVVASPWGSPPPYFRAWWHLHDLHLHRFPLPGAPADASRIQVFVLPPSPSELYVSQNPKIRCLATSLPSDEGMVVSWTRKQGGTLRPHLHPLKAQFNGTFTATSEVPISTYDWEAGETFTCTINHAELPSPISRSISKKPGWTSNKHGAWMDGWMDKETLDEGWMDGHQTWLMVGLMDGWTSNMVDGWMDEKTSNMVDGWMRRHQTWWMGGWLDG